MALALTYDFVANTPAQAAQVNANFSAIESYINGTMYTAADTDTLLAGRLANKLVDPTQLTANSATFTTITDIAGFTITFTALAARMYKLEMCAHVSSSVAGDWVALRLRTNAGTTIQSAACEVPVINEEQTLNLVAFVTPGAGAVTYKISGERLSGTGNCMVEAAATYPAILSVQDFGAD